MILKRLVDGSYVEPLKATGESNWKTAHSVSVDQVRPQTQDSELHVSLDAKAKPNTKRQLGTLL